MSSIPVFVLGVNRKGMKEKAIATRNHLKKVGFKNVRIYYGADIRNKPTYIADNGDKKFVKLNQITMFNSLELLRKKRDLKELIYAEDDVRITKPEELFKHLKNGIKGIERLVYLDKPKPPPYIQEQFVNKSLPYGTQMVGFDNKSINKVGDFNRYYNYDVGLNKHFSPNVGTNYGFEFVYEKGDKPIHAHATKEQIQKSKDFSVHNRYK